MKEKTNSVMEALSSAVPIAEQERLLLKFRASTEFVDIRKKSRAPKGETCGLCEHCITKYEPRICSWNDELTEVVSYPYCKFFNLPLQEIDNGACNKECKKCAPCLIQTQGE